jgi:(E)-4-hydroxy-3-methylbut-2-enyl-diphosphate synthase
MNRPRRKTKQIQVGNVKIGGDAPVSVQSMTTTNTDDVKATVAQILQLENAGCEIIRVAVPDHSSAKSLSRIKSQIKIPLIADIHFDYQLGLIALEEGIDCIRLNPGNIGERKKLEKVVVSAKEKKVPIRIGINAGSLEKDLLEKYGFPTAEAMVESAFRAVNVLEELDFYDTKVSLKASHVSLAVDAYRLFSSK